MKNVFSSEEMQNGFFGKLVTWIADKRQIEEKKRDFDKTLANLFDTFDKYYQLIGCSIQINGMLSRYEEQVVRAFRIAKYDNLRKQFEKEGFEIMGNLGSVFRSVTGVEASDETKVKFTYDYLCQLQNSYEAQMESLNQEINRLKKEIDGLSFLQISKKNELKQKLSEKEDNYHENEATLVKLKRYISNAEPIENEVKNYADHLAQVTKKYSIF